MVEKSRRQDKPAAELYNAGNAASRAGQHSLAIAHYTAAIALDPDFPQAFYNRAIEHSKAGDEESCFFDLISAMELGYDTDEFWATFFGHIGAPLLADLLEDTTLPIALSARIRSRTEEYIQKGTVFLRAFPEYGIQFSAASLPARFMLSYFVGKQEDMSPEVFRSVFDFCLESGRIGDDEFAWRAKSLVATVLYDQYQTTERSPTPSDIGFFWDDFYEMNRPHWGVPESALQATVSTRMPTRAGESVQQHLARFTLALTQDAAETLLQRRAADPPPPGSASLHWDLADFLFKLMVGTAMYLDDPIEVLRCIALARKTNAAFAVSQWTQSRHHPDELLSVVALPSDAAEQHLLPAFLPPGTILTEYFIYETGGDNLVRACVTPSGWRLSQRYLSPSEVEALVGLGRQWQDPEWFNELRTGPDVDPRSLILLSMAATTEVPPESYDEWLGALLDQDVLDSAPDCHRLVFLPYNYLHNLPFHLLPQILQRIDAGQIDEVVVSPSLTLSQRLAQRTPVQRDTASCLFVGINSAEVDARAEYAAVRQSLPRADALLDADATPERVLATAVGYDVIHIACHGGFDIRDNTGYLLLANGERIYPADLALTRGLCADLVVLNACISGVNSREARNGDQALGLPSALLHGGARQVIGTLWQVEANAAVDFASAFYRDWRLVPDSTASIVLRTQRRLRERSTDIFTWGAHAVFGDWR
jgi:hypothetical protein